MDDEDLHGGIIEGETCAQGKRGIPTATFVVISKPHVLNSKLAPSTQDAEMSILSNEPSLRADPIETIQPSPRELTLELFNHLFIDFPEPHHIKIPSQSGDNLHRFRESGLRRRLRLPAGAWRGEPGVPPAEVQCFQAHLGAARRLVSIHGGDYHTADRTVGGSRPHLRSVAPAAQIRLETRPTSRPDGEAGASTGAEHTPVCEHRSAATAQPAGRIVGRRCIEAAMVLPWGPGEWPTRQDMQVHMQHRLTRVGPSVHHDPETARGLARIARQMGAHQHQLAQ